jgi:hypothetical protein
MHRLTITQFEDEIVATYDGDGLILALKEKPTGDFLYDSANMLFRIEEKIKEKKEGK